MKLRGEKELKAEELYELLANEVVKSFKDYIEQIKKTNIEEINNNDSLVELIEEEQPIKYNIFVALLNADLELEIIKALINIQKEHGDLIYQLYKRLVKVKDRVNINNSNEMKNFIIDSTSLLSTYFKECD